MLTTDNEKDFVANVSSPSVISKIVANPNTYIKAATSNNTRKAYQQDIRHFINWGGILPATTETVIQYLSEHAQTLSPRTLERRLAGLSQWHISQSFEDPTKKLLIKKTLKGIKNIHGKPKNKAPALVIDKLAVICQQLNQGTSLIEIRDNALIQLNFFGAFRRSELAAIQYEDIKFYENEGIKIQINRSKTDQEGEGQTVQIPLIKSEENPDLCPITALERWLSHSKITSGPLFRPIDKSGRLSKKSLNSYSINCIIKKITQRYLDDNVSYSSHSLRSGFATSAARANTPLPEIMKQARWVKAETAIGYCEENKSFRENPAFKILQTIKEKR